MEIVDLITRRCKLSEHHIWLLCSTIILSIYCLIIIGFDIAVLLGYDELIHPWLQFALFMLDAVFVISAVVTNSKISVLDDRISRHIPLRIKLPYENVDNALKAICSKRKRKPLENGCTYCRVIEKCRVIKSLTKRITYFYTIPAVDVSCSELRVKKEICVKEASIKYSMKLAHTREELGKTMTVFIYIADTVNEDIRQATCRMIKTEFIENFIIDLVLDTGKMEIYIPGCSGENTVHYRLYRDFLCKLLGR